MSEWAAAEWLSPAERGVVERWATGGTSGGGLARAMSAAESILRSVDDSGLGRGEGEGRQGLGRGEGVARP